jgi:hypothetical protein
MIKTVVKRTQVTEENDLEKEKLEAGSLVRSHLQ